MIYIHKILPIFLSPLFLVVLLIVYGLLRHKNRYVWLALVGLLIASNPIIGRFAIAYLEKNYSPLDISTLPQAQYAVVLGGVLRQVEDQNGEIHYDFHDSVDRFLVSLELIEAQNVERVYLMQAKLPWSIGHPEGEVLLETAKDIGLPTDKLKIIETEVQNTFQEAKAVANVIEKDTEIYLITSAFHMPRAKALFESQGLKPIPLPVDHRASMKNITLIDVLPSASALAQTSTFIREMLGRSYYELRNWIG